MTSAGPDPSGDVRRTREVGRLLGPLARRIEAGLAQDPLGRDPEFIERRLGAVRAYTSYFSPEVRGVENLPVEGPVLVVGNHNCLFYMPDAWVTGLALIERRGVRGPLYVMTYDLLFAIPFVTSFLRRLGALPAAGHNAEQALAEGAAVVVFPGGDWESCRRWVDRNRIDFAGRSGFVRLALSTGVPIVPVVAHGSHDAVVIAARGERLARLMGLHLLRINVFPITVGPPLGLATVLTPTPPLPSQVTVEFLTPIG